MFEMRKDVYAMMKYPKINTIYKRGDGGKIILDQLSRPEFSAIKSWHITEKIDGTNIRIMFNFDILSGHTSVSYGGRTDDAEIPSPLLIYLKWKFTKEKFESVFAEKFDRDFTVYLFGEGYGPKIQNGHFYGNDVSFILFDAYINDWWVEPENVEKLAKSLGVDYVPVIGVMSAEEAVRYVASNPTSRISDKAPTEGIVARSHPLLLFRDGTPLMWKLKVRDFRK